jgi:hypothetical protein
VAPAREVEEPASPRESTAADRSEPGPEASDLLTAWQRVVDQVKARKMTVGSVLQQAQVLGIEDGELRIVLRGNHFHRELVTDRAHMELVTQAMRRWMKNAERIRIVEESDAPDDPRNHPAVRAAIAEFDGEIVRVSRRAPEGEGQ